MWVGGVSIPNIRVVYIPNLSLLQNLEILPFKSTKSCVLTSSLSNYSLVLPTALFGLVSGISWISSLVIIFLPVSSVLALGYFCLSSLLLFQTFSYHSLNTSIDQVNTSSSCSQGSTPSWAAWPSFCSGKAGMTSEDMRMKADSWNITGGCLSPIFSLAPWCLEVLAVWKQQQWGLHWGCG